MSAMHPAVAAPRADLDLATFAVPFEVALDSAEPGIIFAACLTLKSASGTTNLCLSDIGYTSGSAETPAHTNFAPRLTQPLAYRRSTSGRRIGGASLFRGGETAFDLTDQALDIDGTTYTRRSLIDTYSVNDQTVTVKAIPRGYSWETGAVLFEGTARAWGPTADGQIRVSLRGTAEDLDAPLMPATYAGTGGLEGTEDLEGKRKVMLLGGASYNFEPPLLIPGELVYDLHNDRGGNGAPINSVTAVKIGGVPLNLDADYATEALLRAASIASGDYGTCLAEGLIRLGSTPGATVTVDATGATFGGSHVTLPGSLARQVLKDYDPQIADSGFLLGSFNNVDAERGYSLARWIGPDESLTGAEFLSEIAASVEAAWGDDPTGKLQMVLTERPTGGGSLSFSETGIVADSWEPVDLPSDVSPAVRECTVLWKRNYKPLSDIGTAVTGDERTALQEEWRAVSASQSLPLYPGSQVLEVETLIDNATDAGDLRDALLALYDGTLRLARFDGGHRAMTQRIGGKAEVSFGREGFSAEAVRVLGIDADAAQYAFRLEVMF